MREKPVLRDGQIELLQAKGIRPVRRLRGNKICCELDKNIKLIGPKVDATFDMTRPDHVAHVFDALWPCFCKVCGGKYYSRPDLTTRPFLSRI